MFTNLSKSASVLAAGAVSMTLIAPQAASAAMISPINSVSTSSNTAGSLGNTIDQSGLSANYDATTDFDSFVTSTTHAGLNANNAVAIIPPAGVVTYGLGGPVTIEAFALWNENRGGSAASLGVQNFRLFADNDNDFSNGNLGQLGTDFVAVTGSLGQAFNFAATTTSFVHFQIIDNYGDPRGTTYGEVAFKTGTVPEPLTILGAGTAVAFGAGFKRKLGKAKKK